MTQDGFAWCLLRMVSTTDGSASVVISPSSLVSLDEILRRILLMILPERVLGRPGVICDI